MEHALALAAGTVIMRPYVVAFFAAYLVAAVLHLGWRTTLSFTVIGYAIAFASEWSSIHTGIPYGWYYYIDRTSDRELWMAGVPFFDSLSYVFLAYCSYATALLIVAPLRASRCNLVSLETRALRRAWDVLLLGSLLQVYLDIVIDPVALQGRRWFLGQIYGYREPGVHFGVPLSNYLGWWLVSLLLVVALGLLATRGGGMRPVPFRSLLGPALYVSVIAFNLAVTFWIGEALMGTTGIFIFALPIVLVAVLLRRRANRCTQAELDEHRRDFPWSTF